MADTGISIGGTDVGSSGGSGGSSVEPTVGIKTLNISDLLGKDPATRINAIATATPAQIPSLNAAALQGVNDSVQAARKTQMEQQQAHVQNLQASAAQDALVKQLTGQQQREQEVLIANTAERIITPDQVIAYTDKLKQQDSDLDTELSGIRKRQQNGILDNPTQWLYDQFALPADIKAYNTGVQLRNSTEDTMNSLLAASTGEAANIKATNLNKTAEIVAAEAKQQMLHSSQLAFAANSQLATTSVEMQQWNAEAVGKTISVRQNELAQKMQAQSLEYDRQRTESTVAVQAQQQQMNTYVLNNESAFVSAVSHANDLFGTKESPATFKLLPQDVQNARLALAAANASNAYIQPSEALQLMNTAGVHFTSLATSKLHEEMQADWLSRVQKEANKSSMLTPQAQAAKVALDFNAAWGSVGKNLQTGNTPTGYGIPSYGAIAAGAGQRTAPDGTSVANVPLYNEIIKPMVENASTMQTKPTIADLFYKTSSLVNAGKLDPHSAAVQLATIGSAITAENMTQTNQRILGMPPPSSLTALLPNSGNAKVNLMDAASIENQLQVEKNMKTRASIQDALKRGGVDNSIGSSLGY